MQEPIAIYNREEVDRPCEPIDGREKGSWRRAFLRQIRARQIMGRKIGKL